MIEIAINGAGRMAREIAGAAQSRDDMIITATVGPETPDWDSLAPHFFSLDDLPSIPALLIDFSLPAGTRTAALWCSVHDVALLSGVTGLGDEATGALRTAADRVPVLWSPNLSIGVNLLAVLARQAASVLDPDTPVAIEDIHHQWKKDAPSGTALMLGEAINSQRGEEPDGIRYSSVREGEVVGEHTINFKMEGEEFDLVHRARDRKIYALGALSAGKWLISQPAGLYSAANWLEGRSAGLSEG
jgi:4-hydroxy-tetrahydrodipicolinate reductase